MTAPITNHAAPVNAVTTAATISISNPAMTKGRLYLLSVTADRGSNAAMGDPTAAQDNASGVDPVWTIIRHQAYSNTSREKTSVFRCQPTEDKIAGTVVITWPETSTRRVAVIDRTDDTIRDDSANNGAACIVQNESTPYNSLVAGYSETLTNPVAAGNICYGVSGARWGAAGAMLPGSGYVEISDHGTNSGATLNITHQTECWNPSNGAQDGVIDNTRDSAGTNNGCMIGLELDFAVVPGDVFAVAAPTDTELDAAGASHYGGDKDDLLLMLDPAGVGGETFATAWWGKSVANSRREILLTDRFAQLIRQSSKRQAPSTTTPTHHLWYGGGDILGTALVALAGDDNARRYWTGGDVMIAAVGSVNLTTNEYTAESLPNRNHLLSEFKDGEADAYGATRDADALGAGFRTESGANASTWATPNQTSFPGDIYWCLDLLGGTTAGHVFYVAAWRVDPDGGGELNHNVMDSHILRVGVFGTVDAAAVFDHGSGADVGYACQFLDDDPYTYVFFREFDPIYGPGTPNHFEDLSTDTTYLHIARIDTSGALTPMDTQHTGTVFTNYQWWDGTAWSDDSADSVRMTTTAGADIAGESAVTKVAADHYVMVAQRYFENERRVYRATTPQGPWTLIANVSTPPYGELLVTDRKRTCVHMKLYRTSDGFPASTGNLMSMSYIMDFPSGPSPGSFPRSGQHIATVGLPYFIEVPDSGQPQTLTGSPSVVNVLGIGGTLISSAALTGSPSVVNVAGTGGTLAGSNATLAGSPSVVNVLGIAGDPAGSDAAVTGSSSVINVVGIGGTLTASPATLTGSPSVVNVAGVGGVISGEPTAADGNPSTVNIAGEPGTLLGSPAELAGTPSVVNVVGIGGELEQGQPPGGLAGSPSVVNVLGTGGGLEGSPATLSGSPSVVVIVAIAGNPETTYGLAGSPSVVNLAPAGGTLEGSPAELTAGLSVVNVVGIGGTLSQGVSILEGSPSIINITTEGGLAFVGEMPHYLPVNIEALVSAFLRDQSEIVALVMDRVYTVLPKPPPGRDVPSEDNYPCIRVTQIDDDPNDGPLWGIGFSVQVEAFGGTKYQAWVIAATARALMDTRIPGTHTFFGIVSGISHGGMSDIPDEGHRPAKPRWLFTSTITAHPIGSLTAS